MLCQLQAFVAGDCGGGEVSLAFCIFVFYNLQPVERNPYFYVGDEEEEEVAAETLQMRDLEVT